MKRTLIFTLFALVVVLSYAFYDKNPKDTPGPTYVGSYSCGCHNTYIWGYKTDNWVNTLHGKAQMVPGPGSVLPNWTGTISMGSAYGNASVTLSIVSGVYKVTLNPSSGTPITYDVAQTRGSAWTQYYHTKIGNSYYRLPFGWKNGSYKNPAGGSFSTSPSSWFNTDGTLKSTSTNTFRATSWDKGCSGCHTTGERITKVVSGPDTSWTAAWANGSDTMNAKVGCEECHGPGSDHILNPTTDNIFGPTRMGAAGLTRQLELCGQCHFRGTSTNTSYSFAWKESADSAYQPGTPLQNYIKWPWQNYINRTGGPSFWPDSMTTRADRTEWQEMSYHPHSSIMNCYECHDPHNVTAYPHQVKYSIDSNSLCLQCHTNFGTPNNPNIPAITAHTKHSYDPLNHYQTGGSSRCTNCHMTKTATVIKDYDIPSHTFYVIPPIKTLQYFNVTTPTLGMLNSCAASCHRNPGSAAGTSNVPGFGVGYDSNITNWREHTDSLLADTLNRWFQRQIWVIGIKKISGEVPEVYTLSQNYPNPFNPETEIKFSIPKASFVTVRTYDIMGREVYNLVSDNYTPGTYSVKWRSMNKAGEYVASGVYFYRIIAGNFIKTKKMVLVK